MESQKVLTDTDDKFLGKNSASIKKNFFNCFVWSRYGAGTGTEIKGNSSATPLFGWVGNVVSFRIPSQIPREFRNVTV